MKRPRRRIGRARARARVGSRRVRRRSTRSSRAPGNPGMAALGACVPVAVEDARAIAAPRRRPRADLVVVGPEVPLVAGAVDAIEARGRLAFGPPAAAARLEGSKAWMKEVLAAAGVPTARYRAFGASDEQAALAFLGDAARPLRGEDRRPRRRQGRGRHRVDRPRRATRCASYLSGDGVRRRRPHARDRGGPAPAPRSRCSCSCDGRDRRAAGPRPGLQAHRSTATSGRTPAAWARTRRSRSSARTSSSG